MDGEQEPGRGEGRPSYATAAPFYRTAHILTTHLEPGFVVVELRPGTDVTDAAGKLMPGLAPAAVDAALGAAVHSLLPETMVSQTIDLRLDYLPGADRRSDRVVVRGRAVHLGSATGLARGEVVDGSGALRALATCRSIVRPATEDELIPLNPAGGADPLLLLPPTPPPELRSEPEVTSPVDLDGFLATELARRLELSVESVGERTVTTRIPASSGLTNMYGTVHGGAVSLFCEVGIAVALHALLPRGSGFAILDFALNFMRPVPAGGSVAAVAEIVHSGRRLGVVRVQLRNAEGRVTTIASSTVCLERT